MRLQFIYILVIGILLLINLGACNILPVGQPTVVVNQNWVIFTKRQAEDTEIALWLVKSDDYWMPSTDDILKLEGKIADYLSQNSRVFYRQPPVWERLDEYQRQYIGIEREGKRIIFGNFFCTSGDKNWRQELIFVLDGGECYFQIEYDVESESFIMLMVNGEA